MNGEDRNNLVVIYIVCPFCGEDDFDKEGLKGHLVHDCEEYAKIEVEPRMFT